MKCPRWVLRVWLDLRAIRLGIRIKDRRFRRFVYDQTIDAIFEEGGGG